MSVDDRGTVPAAPGRSADEVAEQVLRAALGQMELLSIYLGDRLGWYESLRRDGPATPTELAARTRSSSRYAREWLEQQAVVGLLEVESSKGGETRFVLSTGAAEVLTDVDSLSYLAPLARLMAAVGPQLPDLLDAYRSGAGVSWDRFGTDAREGQAAMNRPWFLYALPAALAGVAELDDVLRRSGARVLDVGCGAGWSSIALATAYPQAEVDGVDVDEPSIEMARQNAAGRGLDARLRFHSADAAHAASAAGGYDVAFAFECVHDMPRPVEVLSGIRRALRPGGVLVVVDEAVADDFTAPGDDVERLMYGFSLFVCLPDGMDSTPSEATGTVMRPAVLRGYAERAGFTSTQVLPVSDFGFLRFYALR